ncbi:hypothetical protein, partial [Rummeliibacillus suwonensis]|uniref:hypothetical protein n=1 Tax=Rummeliibacillus suwonensis TaxID=1306154 RepID=UPI0028A2A08C
RDQHPVAPSIRPQESEQAEAEINKSLYFHGLNWIINTPVKILIFSINMNIQIFCSAPQLLKTVTTKCSYFSRKK